MMPDLVGPHEMRDVVADLAKRRLNLLFIAMRTDEEVYRLERDAQKFRRMAEELDSKMCDCVLEIDAMEQVDAPKVSYG